jgi:metallo-beta-lactamase class B
MTNRFIWELPGPACLLLTKGIRNLTPPHGYQEPRSAILFRMLLRSLALCIICSAILFAQNNPDWTEPFPPHKIIANIYYVGSKDLASFLMTTPQGHILINSNLEGSVPSIKENIERLGFRFSDIKILLISHAHFDHCAGSALIKQMTGAKYMVMQGDVPVVEDGGHSDFQYRHSSGMFFKPAKVDRILHDGDEVRLGDVVLTAHLTAGHTKGCTTWTLQVRGDGKVYNVVIVGSPNVNPGYKLVHNSRYPQIAHDYEHTFEVLKSLPCDIFLGAHGSYYGMDTKFGRIGKTVSNPFVDPTGYKDYVADREQAFRSELAKQQATRH